jgi:hypothetical protein
MSKHEKPPRIILETLPDIRHIPIMKFSRYSYGRVGQYIPLNIIVKCYLLQIAFPYSIWPLYLINGFGLRTPKDIQNINAESTPTIDVPTKDSITYKNIRSADRPPDQMYSLTVINAK